MMLGLQRLLFGSLRPSEIEQLYEKSWYAVTETCLAMTIFRDEVGGWFMVMFVSLLIGKVWGWIGEGRVEILEQQPPADPRLFHIRLSSSLILSSLFQILMFRYSVQTVLLQARPNMMVMFAFEFAVLTVTSLSTAARYLISLYESSLIRNQVSRRRAQLNQQLQSTQDVAPEPEPFNRSGVGSQQETFDNPNNNIDIDVPGWEDKGRWVFYLDLVTGMILLSRGLWTLSYKMADFCKLVLYLTFFSVLCMFYGMPIHIIRDVAITVRSFYKRISDFLRYRQATKDMNTRYPDATADEMRREDVCIICREVMHISQRHYEAPDPQNGQGRPGVNDQERSRNHNTDDAAIAGDERFRPKKLPCGHILHCTCLRSWLERQQNCPTCRAPVLVSNPVVPRSQSDNATGDRRVQEQQPQANDRTEGAAPQRNVGQNTVNFGPFRLSFGVRQAVARDANNANRANLRSPAQASTELQQRHNSVERLRQASTTHGHIVANASSSSYQGQLLQLEQQLLGEIRSLGAQAAQLFLVRTLEAELARLRMHVNDEALPPVERPLMYQSFAINPIQRSQPFVSAQVSNSSHEQRDLQAGQQGLPNGLRLPRGWSVLSLRRVEVDGESASMISSLPIFNNVSTESSVTNPIIQPTSSPVLSAVGSQTMEQHDMLQETGKSAEGRADLSAPSSLLDISHSFPSKGDADIQLVRCWDEAEVAQRNIAQGHANSTIKRMNDHWLDTGPSYASPESIDRIGSQYDSSTQKKYGDQPVKLSSEDGTDQLVSGYTHVDGYSERTSPTISRSQWKGKGKAVTVEDLVEERNEDRSLE